MADHNWDAAWEGGPVDGDLVSGGDEQILDSKSCARFRNEVEHDCHQLNANFTDTGRHKTGSARAFFIDEAVTGHPATLMLPSNAGAWPPTVADADRLGSNALDNGRLWIDWDDCQPYICEYEQTGGNWTPLNTDLGTVAPAYHPAAASTWISLWPRTWTEVDVATDNAQKVAVANTMEEITGGLVGPLPSAVANVLGVTVVIPDDGREYTVDIQANISYQITAANAAGFWLREEDASAGGPNTLDFKYVSGSNVNATECTLRYIHDADSTLGSPVGGETYYYYVMMAASSNALASFNVNVTDQTLVAGQWYNVLNDLDSLTSWCRIFATVSNHTGDPADAAPAKPYVIDI